MSDAPEWLERLADGTLDEVSESEAAVLKLPSGRVVACDPLVFLRGADPFARKLKPGEYRVAIGRRDRESAYAVLRLKDAKVKRWEVARCPGEEDAEGWPGFSVDSGVGCFVDHAAIEAYAEAEDAELMGAAAKALADGDDDADPLAFHARIAKARAADDPLARIERQLERGLLASTPIDPANGANIIAFRIGGEGVFASFFGLDGRGSPVCLVTDFGVMEPAEDESEDESEPLDDLEDDEEDALPPPGVEDDLDDEPFGESDLAGLEALAAALGIKEEPEIEQGPSPLFLQTRDLLRRWVAEEKLELEEDTNVDILAEALLEKLVSLAGHRRPGVHVGEWLLDRAEVADVFASDDELDRDLTRR